MVRPLPYTPSNHGSKRRGFALLITITLLAFLVLLLVSLASLTRVETQVANNNQHISQARQNALMALNIALGQLQKYAGPDQRVTTTADLIADKDKTGAATPAPLYSTTAQVDVKPGSRYWTAVWGNTEQNISYSLRPNQVPPTAGNRRGITPGLLNWLISGNESAVFTPKGTAGGVNAGTGITYRPGDAVDLSDLTQPKVKGNDAIILVGENSIGTGATAQKDYVVAPLMNIEVAPAQIPGADATSSTPIRTGRYAWWVGDEGVKARINLQNGYQQTGAAADQINSFLIGQRTATEFMDRDPSGTTSPTLIGTDFDFTSSSVSKISSPFQLPLTTANTTVQARLASTAKNRFHDMTAASFGVLSDTYAGGLKKDLTADIADTSADFSYRPANSDPIFTPVSNTEEYLPTWGHLRTWARTHPDGASEFTPTPGTATNAGLGPVLAYSALGYDVRVLSDRRVSLVIFPIIALYNPYTVAIAPARYEVSFKFSPNSRMSLQTAPDGSATWTRAGEIDWGVPEIRATDVAGTASNDISFKVNGRSIPPGESHIYYLPASNSGAAYAPGFTLERAPAGSPAVPLSYLEVASSLTLPSDVVITTTPASHYMRLLLTYTSGPSANGSGTNPGWGNATNCPRTTVTLAREGGLTIPDEWYQRSDVMLMTSGTHPGGQVIRFNGSIIPINLTAADAGSFLRISDMDDWAGLTQGPRSAFRYCSNLEGGGSPWQGSEHTGLPQLAKIWLRHGNVRAPYGQLSISESGAPRGLNRHGNMLFGVVMGNDTTGRNVARLPTPNEYTLSMNFSEDAGTPTRHTTLFDVLDTSGSLLSLGQFQHVPFSRYSFYSAYPFANSMADLRVPRTTHYRTQRVARPSAPTTLDPVYDLSWHLNRALWDKYFLSSAPSALNQADINDRDPLPNSRLAYSNSNGGTPDIDSIRYNSGPNQAYAKAAANLLNAGSFNINSTSEQAWRTVIAGTSGLPQNNAYASSGDNVDESIPFPRFSKSLQRPAGSGSGLYRTVTDSMNLSTAGSGAPDFRTTLYHGNRGLLLNDTVASTNDNAANLVKELARTMVREVRMRGPFLSLSDFVNRSMATTTHELGIKGALQSAIDNMETSQANPYERWKAVTNQGVTKTGYYQGDVSAYAYPEWDVEHYLGCTTDVADNFPARSASRFTYAFSPKYLTQADVLSTLGPSLSPRSDTFTIRTYGEKINPATQVVEGKAWCEAVVQRTSAFVNPANPAETSPTDPALAAENTTFGRKFVIVSFRWLSPSDI